MSSSKSKQHKHGPSKSTSKSSSHTRISETNNAASTSSSGKQAQAETPPLSFLFVVNELTINYDDHRINPAEIPKDNWHNFLPPKCREHYGPEIPSEVMRFSNGLVSRASTNHVRYYWTRQAPDLDGGIAVQLASSASFYAQRYKTASVFSCNPLLPIIVAQDDALLRPPRSWDALHFVHSRSGTISQACYDSPHSVPQSAQVLGAPVKFAAGIRASWIPSLVPCSYANPYEVRRSGGLGGELGIVLGLMAFHSRRQSESGRDVNEVFLGRPGERSGLWRGYQWRTSSPPLGYPLSMQETPRGFLVYICLDPENPRGSTMQSLADLEWKSALVQG